MLIALFFLIIAIMRVIQKICTKRVSNESSGIGFFHFSGYYQLLAALFSLITLAISGFCAIDRNTVLCSLLMSFFLAVSIFASLEVLKSTSLVVSQMFTTGSVIVSALCGIFLFDENLNVYAWIGIVLFMFSFWCVIYKPQAKEESNPAEKKKFTVKTLVLLIVELLGCGFQTVTQAWFGKYVIPESAEISLKTSMNASFNLLSFAFNAIILYACYLIYSLIKSYKDKDLETRKRAFKPLSKNALICGALLALALFAISMLATSIQQQMGQPGRFTLISMAITVGITILVSTIIYKEKLNVINAVGIALGLASVLIINFQEPIATFLANLF